MFSIWDLHPLPPLWLAVALYVRSYVLHISYSGVMFTPIIWLSVLALQRLWDVITDAARPFRWSLCGARHGGMTGQMTTRQRKKIKSSVCEYKTSLHIDPVYKPVHETGDIYICVWIYTDTHILYIYIWTFECFDASIFNCLHMTQIPICIYIYRYIWWYFLCESVIIRDSERSWPTVWTLIETRDWVARRGDGATYGGDTYGGLGLEKVLQRVFGGLKM